MKYQIQTQKWILIDGEKKAAMKPQVLGMEFDSIEEAENDSVAHDQDFGEFGWWSKIIPSPDKRN